MFRQGASPVSRVRDRVGRDDERRGQPLVHPVADQARDRAGDDHPDTILDGIVADTRGIYGVGWSQAAETIARTDLTGADAILVSGTGMPSLPLIGSVDGPPILTSNLCLAARLLDQLGLGHLLGPGLAPEGWRDRLQAALA